MSKPKQIGERVEVIDGQPVKIRIFEPRPAQQADAQAAEMVHGHDDACDAIQRYMRLTRERFL